MSRIGSFLGLCAVFVLSACGGSSTPAPAEPAPPAAAEPAATADAGPMFSALQVRRGNEQFSATCSACHSVGEFADSGFQARWSRRSVGDLYERIITTMPDDAPGILTPEQTINLVSYILEMNGLEAGSSNLDPDQEELDAISLSVIRS